MTNKKGDKTGDKGRQKGEGGHRKGDKPDGRRTRCPAARWTLIESLEDP